MVTSFTALRTRLRMRYPDVLLSTKTTSQGLLARFLTGTIISKDDIAQYGFTVTDSTRDYDEYLLQLRGTEIKYVKPLPSTFSNCFLRLSKEPGCTILKTEELGFLNPADISTIVIGTKNRFVGMYNVIDVQIDDTEVAKKLLVGCTYQASRRTPGKYRLYFYRPSKKVSRDTDEYLSALLSLIDELQYRKNGEDIESLSKRQDNALDDFNTVWGAKYGRIK